MKYKTRIYTDTGSFVTVEIDSNFKFEKNLAMWEVVNKSASDAIKMAIYPETWITYKVFQRYRELKNQPVKIKGNYRTKSFNNKVGGNANSAHLRGDALDTIDPGLTLNQHKINATLWQKACKEFNVIGAIGFYDWGNHLECFTDMFYGAKTFQIWDERTIK